MKYQSPPGEAADAPFLDGNRSAGIKGSVVPGKAIEHPQRELAHLITFSGQTPDDTDLTQVRKAIEALIAAAAGEGEPGDYITLAQLRQRLPIYPEILSADGRMTVTSPTAGSILVPPTVACQHRGCYPFSTSDYDEGDRSFATAVNKTYHLRWNPSDGFLLKDTVDPAYNPTLLNEADPIFDSTFDDMLVSRVVTNASNVATITNLMNKHAMTGTVRGDHDFGVVPAFTALAPILDDPIAFGWARTPIASIAAHGTSGGSNQAGGLDIGKTQFNNPAQYENIVTRYDLRVAMQMSNNYNVAQQRYGFYIFNLIAA